MAALLTMAASDVRAGADLPGACELPLPEPSTGAVSKLANALPRGFKRFRYTKLAAMNLPVGDHHETRTLKQDQESLNIYREQ
jgi:hypothetical protein